MRSAVSVVVGLLALTPNLASASATDEIVPFGIGRNLLQAGPQSPPPAPVARRPSPKGLLELQIPKFSTRHSTTPIQAQGWYS